MPDGEAPGDRAAAALAYFDALYASAEACDAAFHAALEAEVRRFARAETPECAGLDGADFPFTLHRAARPRVVRGKLKARERALAKCESEPGGGAAWPPAAVRLMDLVRASVLFEDAYELVAFLHVLMQRFTVVRVKNRFEDFDPGAAGSFRNVHANLLFPHRGETLVVEVQLHLVPAGRAAPLSLAEAARSVLGPPPRVALLLPYGSRLYGASPYKYSGVLHYPTARASKAHRPTTTLPYGSRL